MAGDQVEIKIMADASDFKSGTMEASAAVDTLGSRFETAAVSTGRMETSMVHLTSHMIGHAIPGMGRMALMMGRMGESAIGAAPLLAGLIPIAAFIGGIEIMEKMEEAELKTAQVASTMADSHKKVHDQIMAVDEAITGLTKGPMAELIQKEHDLGMEANDLTSIFKEDNAVLENQLHWWQKTLEALDKFGEGMHKLIGTGHATIIDPTEFDTLRTKIALAHGDIGALNDAMEAVKSLRMRIGVSGGNEGVTNRSII
jgi:hypothetical protein